MIAYAVSPIDLIPDFIPVLGMLDDLIIVPLGIALAVRLTPQATVGGAAARGGDLDREPAEDVVGGGRGRRGLGGVHRPGSLGLVRVRKFVRRA